MGQLVIRRCSMRCRLWFPVWMVVALACGADSAVGPPPPAGFDASGDWAFADTLRAQDVTCNDQGVFTLLVSGSAVSGHGYVASACTGPGGSASDSGEVLISDGVLSGASIHFHADVCVYQGTLFSAGTEVKAQGSVTCTVPVDGGVVQLRGSWHATYVVDVTPPAVSATMTLPVGDTAAVPGDTVTLQVTASDGRRLAFVGYALGAPASRTDSTAVTAASATLTLRAVLPPASVGRVRVTVFARASAGFRTVTVVDMVSVLDMIRRPSRALTLPAPVLGIAMDTKRNLVYLSYFGRQEIGVVDLAAGGFTTAIATTFRPRSLDLSLGGDSLIVSVDSQPELGIVNLVTTPHPISIVHVDSVGSSGGRFVADNVRVMGSGKAIVSLTYETPYSCCTGYLVDFDLGDGTSTLRTGSDRNTPLARSWDRSRLVAVAGSTSPVQAWLYIAANDSFAPPRLVTIPVNVYPSSADSTGSRFLLANALFDGELNPLLAISDTAYKQGGATVLSPDGATAYLATWDGYLKVRTSDGVVLERLRLPFWAFQFAITPDGGTLIAVGGTPIYFEPPNNQVVLIDLR